MLRLRLRRLLTKLSLIKLRMLTLSLSLRNTIRTRISLMLSMPMSRIRIRTRSHGRRDRERKFGLRKPPRITPSVLPLALLFNIHLIISPSHIPKPLIVRPIQTLPLATSHRTPHPTHSIPSRKASTPGMAHGQSHRSITTTAISRRRHSSLHQRRRTRHRRPRTMSMSMPMIEPLIMPMRKAKPTRKRSHTRRTMGMSMP